MNINALVKEAIAEVRENGDETSKEFVLDPIIMNNVSAMGSQVPILGVMFAIDDGVLAAVRTLMVLSYQTGIRVGKQQVMDEFIGKGEGE